MWYHRGLSDRIANLARQFPALVLTGARQTGKTSLLTKLFPKHHYVSLDLPHLAAMAEDSPDAFLQAHPPPIIIDEVQYAPKIFRHLKIAIDAHRHDFGQFILTGSQKFALMREVSDSLAGRVAVLELETLSGQEISSENAANDVPALPLAHLITKGGFPDLWRSPDVDQKIFYDSYLATYLERDVRQLINVVSLRDFERFIRICASRTGQILDKSAIASEVGVRSPTINDWLSVLIASNQIYLLEPWFGNFGKRLVKSPKLYFADSGFASYFLSVSPEHFNQSPFCGALWETYVFSELRKINTLSTRPRSLWYYRDNEQREIDFLVLGGSTNLAVECKWHEIPQPKDAKPILELQNYLQANPRPELHQLQGIILCRSPGIHPIGDIKGMPLENLRSLLR